MSDELRKLRDQVYDLAIDEDPILTDEEWYEELWKLLDPVIDARAHRATEALPTAADVNRTLVEYQRAKQEKWRSEQGEIHTHNAGEYRDPSTGQTVEEHRFSFEGSTGQLAKHLIREHHLPPSNVQEWAGGLTQGDWTSLDELHRDAHKREA